ncbi:unnamed protein product, partial [Laminaria digitata]
SPHVAFYRNTRKHDVFRPESDITALKWWAGKQSTFPTVAKLARKHLAVQASSTASESLFSVRSTITKKSNHLSGEVAADIIFLHETLMNKLW